jgi:hypothetical protein
MNSQEDEDQYLMYAVDSCTADIVSANPYWSMSDTQRAEWKSYSRCRLAQEQDQEQYDAQNSGSDDNNDGDQENNEAEELGAEGQNQQTEEIEPTTATDEPDQPAVVKEDKKKLWVTYQQWARSALREETGNQKIPLKTVNARARIAWIEDGWGTEK